MIRTISLLAATRKLPFLGVFRRDFWEDSKDQFKAYIWVQLRIYLGFLSSMSKFFSGSFWAFFWQYAWKYFWASPCESFWEHPEDHPSCYKEIWRKGCQGATSKCGLMEKREWHMHRITWATANAGFSRNWTNINILDFEEILGILEKRQILDFRGIQWILEEQQFLDFQEIQQNRNLWIFGKKLQIHQIWFFQDFRDKLVRDFEK